MDFLGFSSRLRSNPNQVCFLRHNHLYKGIMGSCSVQRVVFETVAVCFHFTKEDVLLKFSPNIHDLVFNVDASSELYCDSTLSFSMPLFFTFFFFTSSVTGEPRVSSSDPRKAALNIRRPRTELPRPLTSPPNIVSDHQSPPPSRPWVHPEPPPSSIKTPERTGRAGPKSTLPVVLGQASLQLRYPAQFVQEPLVDGRQLVDAVDAHATVEGLNRKNGTGLNVIFIGGSTQVTHVQKVSWSKNSIKAEQQDDCNCTFILYILYKLGRE